MLSVITRFLDAVTPIAGNDYDTVVEGIVLYFDDTIRQVVLMVKNKTLHVFIKYLDNRRDFVKRKQHCIRKAWRDKKRWNVSNDLYDAHHKNKVICYVQIYVARQLSQYAEVKTGSKWWTVNIWITNLRKTKIKIVKSNELR